MKRKRVRETFETVLFWAYGRRVSMRVLHNPKFKSGDRVRVTVELVERKAGKGGK
jgi:ribosomal protein L19